MSDTIREALTALAPRYEQKSAALADLARLEAERDEAIRERDRAIDALNEVAPKLDQFAATEAKRDKYRDALAFYAAGRHWRKDHSAGDVYIEDKGDVARAALRDDTAAAAPSETPDWWDVDLLGSAEWLCPDCAFTNPPDATTCGRCPYARAVPSGDAEGKGSVSPRCNHAPFGGSPECNLPLNHLGPHSWAGPARGEEHDG